MPKTPWGAEYPDKPSEIVEELKPGTKVRLRSGTEGWVQGSIVEYTELDPPSKYGRPLGAAMYVGPHYRVYILEGKHKGETLTLPANYVQVI